MEMREGEQRISERAYFPLLDSLRGIAALGVFVLHIAFYLGLGTGTGVADYLVEHVSNYPAPSVVIFFGLSGFVLYRPFAARRYQQLPADRYAEYGIRRAARILPAYWCALIIGALVLHRGYVFSPSGLLRYFAFTQVYDQHTFDRGLSVAWSLDVDVAFYACLPLLVLLIRRASVRSRAGFLRSELTMCALLYASSTIWQGVAVHLFLHSQRWFFPAELSFPGSLDIMACGMAMAVLSVAFGDGSSLPVLRIVGERPWIPWGIAVLAYVLIGQVPHSFFVADPALAWILTKQLRSLLAVGALLPLIFGAGRGGVLRSVLASPPARFLGIISYAFYLWHWVVIQALADHHFGRHGKVLFVVVALIASIALATASWYLLERPVNRAVRRRLRRDRPEREPPSVVDPPDHMPAGLV